MISQLIAVTCLLCLHDQMFVGAAEMTLQEGAAVYNTSIELAHSCAIFLFYLGGEI